MQDSKPAKYGDTITVHFTCTLEDGTVIDSTKDRKPLQITIGKSGLIEGFEKSFIKMKPGETKSVALSPDKAYGLYDDELKKVLNRAQFPADLQPEVGFQLKFQHKDHEKIFRVTDVTDSTVTLDANHPYAGKELLFDIELVDILKEGPRAQTYFDLGTTLQDKEFYEEAMQHYRNAIETDPDFPEPYFRLGVIHHIQGRLDDAIANYQKVLQLQADHLDAMINLGNALKQKGDTDTAIEYYTHALQINPDHASLHNSLGAVFQVKGAIDDAIEHYQKAITLDADFIEGYNNLGMAYKEKLKLEMAADYFRKAIQMNPNFTEAHVNLAFALLLSGNLSEGWEEYEWRLTQKSFDSQYHTFSFPAWDGSSLQGKTFLICAEQGVGDEIMFASCLPDIVDQTETTLMECDKRLMPLLKRSFPNIIFFERNMTDGEYPEEIFRTDFKISIGSLVKYYRKDITSFSPQRAYLTPDYELVETWKKRLQSLGSHLKIGISWRGGEHPYHRYRRSIELNQWEAILTLPDVAFINLQYGNVTDELSVVREKYGVKIHDGRDSNPLDNLDDLAAKISALDLVISIDNTTAHLAGALGKSVWTLLPFVPDWRWMLEKEDSPWYPSMRLFRQASPGDWNAVLTHVTDEIKKYP